MIIDISKKSKAAVLAALFNRAKPEEIDLLLYDPSPMNEEQASFYLQSQTAFYYLNGKILKVDLSKNYFDAQFYDKANGKNAAQIAVDSCPNL